jgi:hypothetical protein
MPGQVLNGKIGGNSHFLYMLREFNSIFTTCWHDLSSFLTSVPVTIPRTIASRGCRAPQRRHLSKSLLLRPSLEWTH